MIRCSSFSARRLRLAVLVVFLIVPLIGCQDTVGPCHHCDDSDPVVDVTTRTFTIGDGDDVRVDNFAGRVVWRTGAAGRVRVSAARRVSHWHDMDSIELFMISHVGGLDITTANPENVRNATVDIEITAPADVIADLATGVGDIDYKARPRGSCRFVTGVGSIKLVMPGDVDVTVDLRAAVGSIYSEFAIEGTVSSPPGVVRGRIGNGGDAYVSATTAVGNVHLMRW